MMEALTSFGGTVLGMLKDVLPIAAILIGFQVLVLRQPIRNPASVAFGLLLLAAVLVRGSGGLRRAAIPAAPPSTGRARSAGAPSAACGPCRNATTSTSRPRAT